MTLRLKSALTSARITQCELAAAVGMSRSSLNSLINHDTLPRAYDRTAIEGAITRYVRRRGGDCAGLFKEEPLRANATAPISPRNNDAHEDEIMLLRKQSLTPQARRHFELTADPFADPVTTEDVFLSPDIRYVRESIYQVARHGGFMAVVGESGAGKTTIKEELIDRIHREEQPIIVIEPYVLAMEGNDKIGKSLKSQHIAEAIMASVAPLTPLKSSQDAKFRQLHAALRDSAHTGHSHVLIIEEAHSLPTPTLRHLKRFLDQLKDGLRPLVSIILLAQPELTIRLNEHNPTLREVVQRIEIVTLPALDTQLDAYLAHRFKRAKVPIEKIIERGAVEALKTKLTPTRGSGTLLYPLAVHNALAAAMNCAAELGAPTVTADVIRGI